MGSPKVNDLSEIIFNNLHVNVCLLPDPIPCSSLDLLSKAEGLTDTLQDLVPGSHVSWFPSRLG